MEASLPTISIVTPSFNQRVFLPAAMSSILGQEYPALEYVVIDGGSTDGSVDVIRSEAGRLAYWCSEPDGGQYKGINKGFARTRGDIMAWLNADDMYTPWALSVVGEVFAQLPEVQWLTTACPLSLDARGRVVACHPSDGYSRRTFMKGENLPGGSWRAKGFIQQ